MKKLILKCCEEAGGAFSALFVLSEHLLGCCWPAPGTGCVPFGGLAAADTGWVVNLHNKFCINILQLSLLLSQESGNNSAVANPRLLLGSFLRARPGRDGSAVEEQA